MYFVVPAIDFLLKIVFASYSIYCYKYTYYCTYNIIVVVNFSGLCFIHLALKYLPVSRFPALYLLLDSARITSPTPGTSYILCHYCELYLQYSAIFIERLIFYLIPEHSKTIIDLISFLTPKKLTMFLTSYS